MCDVLAQETADTFLPVRPGVGSYPQPLVGLLYSAGNPTRITCTRFVTRL
jgi:hypothetical protein